MSDQPQYPSYPGDETPPSSPSPSPPPYGQAPPPPSYGQGPGGYPPQGYGYQAPPRSSTKAVLGLVLGIVSIVFCYLGLLIGPVAIVLSVMARREIAAAPAGSIRGAGMATAGLVTGIIGTVVWAAVIALLVAVGLDAG